MSEKFENNPVEKLTRLRQARDPKPRPLSVAEQIDRAEWCRARVAEDAKRWQEEVAQQQITPECKTTDDAVTRLNELRQQQGAKPSKRGEAF